MSLSRNIFLSTLLFLLSFPPSRLEAQQNSKFHQFRDLSRPEKWWVLTHPFSASKALEITKFVRNATDSIKTTGLLDGDERGGQLDAFKHAYWMALLTQNLNHRKAWRLGYDHEKGNKLDYMQNANKTDQWLPTALDCTMDLYNNDAGIIIGKENALVSQRRMMEIVISNLQKGNMVIIYKDKNGNLLDCDGNPIDRSKYFHHWEIPACIVPSSYNSQTDFEKNYEPTPKRTE